MLKISNKIPWSVLLDNQKPKRLLHDKILSDNGILIAFFRIRKGQPFVSGLPGQYQPVDAAIGNFIYKKSSRIGVKASTMIPSSKATTP